MPTSLSSPTCKEARGRGGKACATLPKFCHMFKVRTPVCLSACVTFRERWNTDPMKSSWSGAVGATAAWPCRCNTSSTDLFTGPS
eukprot:1363123-Amphidinium_carterae.2